MSVESSIPKEILQEQSEAKIKEVDTRMKEFSQTLDTFSRVDFRRDYQSFAQNFEKVQESVINMIEYCKENYVILISDQIGAFTAEDIFRFSERLVSQYKGWVQILSDAEKEGRLPSGFKGNRTLDWWQSTLEGFEQTVHKEISELRIQMISCIEKSPQNRIGFYVPHLPYSFTGINKLGHLKHLDYQTLARQFQEKNPAHKKAVDIAEEVSRLKGDRRSVTDGSHEERDLTEKISQLEKEIESLHKQTDAEVQALREGKQW